MWFITNASFSFSKFEFLMKWETAIMLVKSAWFFLPTQNRLWRTSPPSPPLCAALYRILIHYYLVLLYGDIAQGQHWLRWWLVAWRHQAITWTNVVFSLVMISGVYLRVISQQLSQGTVVYNKFENILFKLSVTSTSPRDLWVKINEGGGYLCMWNVV